MNEFTPDETRRWTEWQRANGVAARRSDATARAFGLAMLAAAFAALIIALWR